MSCNFKCKEPLFPWLLFNPGGPSSAATHYQGRGTGGAAGVRQEVPCSLSVCMFSFDLLQAFHLLPLGFTVNAPPQLFVVVLIPVYTQNTQLTDTRVSAVCTAERVWVCR